MSANFKAKVLQKMEYRSGKRADGNSWSVQDILVETTDEQYPKKVLLKFINKQTDPLVVGQTYSFDYDVEAREYNGRWYNDVKCWRYNTLEEQQPAPQPYQDPQQSGNGVYYQNPPQQQPAPQAPTKDPDLPF